MKKLITAILSASMAVLMAFGIPSALSAKADEGENVYNLHDVVAYGNYNDVALKWEVVAKEDSKVTLFLKDVLRDGTNNPENMLLKKFNEKDVGDGSADQRYWQSSPIKTFLNGDFYDEAFSAEQKEAIVGVDTSYPGYSSAESTRQGETVENPCVGTTGNPSKVFLPTYGDISSWYSSLEDRALGNTDIWWWTRSPVYVVPGSVSSNNGSKRQLVWYAHEGGENRAPVNYYLALRPVIVVDTEKLNATVTTSEISGTVNAGAKVVLYRGETKIAETTANESGKYSFTVDEGDYVLEVSLEGYTTRRVNVTVGKEDIVKDVTLTAIGVSQTYTISGTVNAGAKVVLYRGETKIAETTADANGRYSFTSVEEGDYVLEVSLDGYTTQKVSLTVGSDDVVKDVTLAVAGENKPEAPEKSGLSSGAIAGIVIACVLVLAAGGIGVFFFMKKKKANK